MALGSVNACTTTEVVDVPFDGGGTDAPVTVADAAGDGTIVDANADVVADDGACHPASAAGFTGEPYKPPSGGYQGVCTDLQIKSLLDCAGGNMTACADLQTDAGASCMACAVTPKGAALWGPLVQSPGSAGTELNEAGCAALDNNDTTTTGCGQALANYTGCLHYTCRDQCPGADYYACAVETKSTSCKVFAAAPKTKCTSAGTECFGQAGDTSNDLATRLIKRFCGTL